MPGSMKLHANRKALETPPLHHIAFVEFRSIEVETTFCTPSSQPVALQQDFAVPKDGICNYTHGVLPPINPNLRAIETMTHIVKCEWNSVSMHSEQPAP